MKIKITTIGILTLIMSSCASIVHGPTQTVDFNSQPSGATITIDGKEFGKTPQSIELRRKGREKGNRTRKQQYYVKIALDGYYPYELKLKREMDGWFLGNLLFGGLIGIIVDASNGAMYKLSPNQVIAQMNKNTNEMANTEDDRIYLAVTMKIDPNWEKIDQLEPVK
nr:PEGA domain-containing protein [uncultured Allomuricauda sp.]